MSELAEQKYYISLSKLASTISEMAKNYLDDFFDFIRNAIAIIKNKLEDFLKQIKKFIKKIIGTFNTKMRIKKQEDNIREKIEKIHINTKKDFNLINNNNIDDINKFKELQFKLIEEDKEKRIKECNEKYKNIMEKLDLIKDKTDFYKFLESLKLN